VRAGHTLPLMRPGRVVLIVFLALVLSGLMLSTGIVIGNVVTADQEQAALDPFYTPPSTMPDKPGVIIRTEALGADPQFGKGYRFLYSTTLQDGSMAVSGAMLFIPDVAAPAEGRKVVGWAHGTVGQGDSCAPSRNPAVGMKDLSGFLPEAMRQGWIVVATDYTGLGTPGPNFYLVGGQEARDVVFSVRAVVDSPEYGAGKEWITFGHSQGGHSALWTGHLAQQIDPELNLLGVAAAAPAAELASITNAQWNNAVGWVIGPEVAVSWPAAYPNLSLDGMVTSAGMANYQRLANECITTAAIEGLVRAEVGQTFFTESPTQNPTWDEVLKLETPAPLPADMPMLLMQGTADTVVLPWPNADLQTSWCAAGSHISALWLAKINHMSIAVNSGPTAVSWMSEVFEGKTPASSCGSPLPVLEPGQ